MTKIWCTIGKNICSKGIHNLSLSIKTHSPRLATNSSWWTPIKVSSKTVTDALEHSSLSSPMFPCSMPCTLNKTSWYFTIYVFFVVVVIWISPEKTPSNNCWIWLLSMWSTALYFIWVCVFEFFLPQTQAKHPSVLVTFISIAEIKYPGKKQFRGIYLSSKRHFTVHHCRKVTGGTSHLHQSHPQSKAEGNEYAHAYYISSPFLYTLGHKVRCMPHTWAGSSHIN